MGMIAFTLWLTQLLIWLPAKTESFGSHARSQASRPSVEVKRAIEKLSWQKLPSRLNSALELCARYDLNNPTLEGRVIADIGADHATLSIALLRQGVASRVYAVDRCETPLETGKTNADQYLSPELRKQIEFRFGEGLSPISPGDAVDTVCILGMGMHSIVKILGGDEDLARAVGAHRLVLQPVDSRPHFMAPLRRWLRSRGWVITDEDLSSGGGGRVYLTVLAEWKEGARMPRAAQEDGELASLILPPPIQRRTRATLQSRQSAALESEASGLRAAKELELWESYVALHKEWIRVARFDAYDRGSGLPDGAISAVLDEEFRSLQQLGARMRY